MISMQNTPSILKGVRPRGVGGARRAFTLVELLIVIGLIVLLMAVAVPVFRTLTGSRSVEQGTNVLSSLLAQTRNQAILNHESRGLCFYYSQDLDRYVAEMVWYDDPTGNPNRIDVVDGGDVYPLPPGIGVSTGYSPTVRLYSVPITVTGMNTYYGTGVLNLPPVIMFNSEGQLSPANYWTAAGGNLTGKVGAAIPSLPTPAQYVLQLFDREPFENAAPANRGTWLDENATPLIVNRYNGTLIKGE